MRIARSGDGRAARPTLRRLKLLADESLEGPLVRGLRAAGFDVEWVLEISPGADDARVLSRASRTRRILITNDKDFASLVFRQKRASFGVVLLRMPLDSDSAKLARLIETLRADGKDPTSHFTTITAELVRVRALP